MALCDKYAPKNIKDFAEYGDTITEIIEKFSSNNKSVIVIAGPCGCGKTTVVDFIVQQCKFKELYIDSHFVKSNKHFSETLMNTCFTYYVKTCIVFSDFEFILNDTVYNNTIKSCILRVPHNVIISINVDCVKKFNQSFCNDINHTLYMLPLLTIASTRKKLNSIIKNENIKVNKSEINKCIDELPDIRKVIQNLEHFNSKDYQFSHSSQCIAHILNNRDISQSSTLDMFNVIPLIHEGYIKHSNKTGITMLSEVVAYCDIIHTHCYKTRAWLSSESALLVLFLSAIRHYSQRKRYSDIDFPNGKVLSKMSNKCTKIQTFARLKDKYNCTTDEQLYVCKLLNSKKCKLLENQFL
jgi:ABC-type dipeptide/oligopeptide/nickel transport system ATPase subunit